MYKKLFFTTIGIALVILSLGAYLETRQTGWVPLRTAVTVDDTALDGTTAGYTYKFADKPSTALPISNSWLSPEIYFYGTDAADETGNYKIYTWKQNGPARLRCYGAVTLGAAVQGGTLTFFADTITVTNVIGSATVRGITPANGIAFLDLGDVDGDNFVYCEWDEDTNASMSCEITGR